MSDAERAREATRPATWLGQEGQSLVEYALIIVLVAMLLLVALMALQDQIAATLTLIGEGIGRAN